jgi:hypothetical protein
MYQVWFTENINPVFTQADKDVYHLLVENQFYPLGNVVAGRQLLRCLCEDFQPIMDFLTIIGKDPIICGVKSQDGIWNSDFPQVAAEYEKHMQPISAVDINGNAATFTPADNTSAGWAGWSTNPPII